MGPTAKPTRQNRTITVDFHDESTYFQLLSDGKAFVESHSPGFSGRPMSLRW